MGDDSTLAQPAVPPGLPAASPACGHVFAEPRPPCPHPPPPEAERCIWHNPAVRKGDAYVARLVSAASAAAMGDLVEASLSGLAAPGIALPGADLRRADLRDADLDGADLAGANLAGAVLRRASLRRARLAGADLTGADLTGTNVAGADLTGANLAGSNIDGTVFNGADLTGADLTGAQVHGFRWNHRTRLDGVCGFSLPPGEGDATAPHPAVAGSLLAEDDPRDDRTREYRAVTGHPSATRPAAVAASDLMAPTGANTLPLPAPSRRGPWIALAVAGCVFACAGIAFGAWGLRAAASRPADAVRIAAERDAALKQAEANLEELRKLQGRAAELEQTVDAARTDAQRAKDEAQVRRAEAADARRRLTSSETELIRLRDADDRAAIMALRLDEAKTLAREQAAALARQEQVGGILAAGVKRLQSENERLGKTVDDRLVEEHRADQLAADVARLSRDNEALKAERDALAMRERRLAGDLADSQRAIQGYLARVAEADLGSVLGDDAGKVPLVPVQAGRPIALGGDYLISLNLDHADGGVAAKLVVQRPAGVANPDVSVVLYDHDQRPLRRLGFGFPRVDPGAPFASASATVACEEFPAFARVIVSPAVTAPVGAR